MAYDMKALTLITAGLLDATVVFGSLTGQTQAVPDPIQLSAVKSYMQTNLAAFTGDSGSGGVKGLVPAPGAGDAAASKFLKADGTWTAVNTGLTIGTTPITSGTTLRFLYDNAGTLGETNGLTWTAGSSTLTLAGPFLFGTDNNFDIGASGANRPRRIYLADFLTSGGAITSATQINAPAFAVNSNGFLQAFADGQFRLTNAAGTGFSLLQFGGTSSSFPAIGRSGTSLVIELADGTLATPITSVAAATLQLGAADAAAPVAQTLQVQSTVAGTSNVAGTDWTFNASRGTGTGQGGNILFKVAQAGTSGTSQNALVQAVNILGSSSLPGIASNMVAGSIVLGATGWPNGTLGIFTTASTFSATCGIIFQAGGNVLIGQGTASSSLYVAMNATNTGLILRSQDTFAWSPSSSDPGQTPDAFLTRAGAAAIRLGPADASSPIAQKLQVQSTVAGTSNTAGVDWTFQASAGTGTGAGGSILFKTAPAGSTGTSQNTFATALKIDQSAGGVNGGLQIIKNGANIALVDITHGTGDGGYISFTNGLFFGRYGGNIVVGIDGSTPLALQLLNNSGIGFYSDSGGTFVAALTTPATATLQHGQADAATAVAQITQVQSVAAGNSNISGANWTLNGSRSTGSGTSGDIIWQTGGTGAGATAQNALVTALTIKGATQQVIMAVKPRINTTPSAVGTGTKTISNSADSSTNFGHYVTINFNGTDYFIPASSVAPT